MTTRTRIALMCLGSALLTMASSSMSLAHDSGVHGALRPCYHDLARY